MRLNPRYEKFSSASSAVQPSSLPNSADVSRAVAIISSIKSSASTTVPSRDFHFSFGQLHHAVGEVHEIFAPFEPEFVESI